MSRCSTKIKASLAFHFNPTTLLTVQLGLEGSGRISLAHFLPDTTVWNLQTSGQSLATQKGPVSHLESQVVDAGPLTFLPSNPIQFPCENKELMEPLNDQRNYL